MNTKLIAATLLTAVSASGAMAADLPMPSQMPIMSPAPVSTWDGPFAGVSIGGATGTETDNLSDIIGVGVTADSFGMSGFSAGVFAGNNWTMDQIVFGVEGDLNYTGLSGSHDFVGGRGGDYEDSYGKLAMSTDWQAFVKGRVGLPVDQFLVYATAGLGAANATLTLTPGEESEDIDAASASAVHFGGTIGIGAEYMFADNLVGRAEIDYSQFTNADYDLGLGTPVSAGWNQTTASVGVSMKF